MSKIKLHYFGIFARGEAIRMLLTKAAVPFEDIRLNAEAFKSLRKQGYLESD